MIESSPLYLLIFKYFQIPLSRRGGYHRLNTSLTIHHIRDRHRLDLLSDGDGYHVHLWHHEDH